MPALTIIMDLDRDGFTALREARPMPDAEREAWLAEHVHHLGNDAVIEIGMLPAGMQSGAPSVAFCFTLPDGFNVVAETSLALLQAATQALTARALRDGA